MVNSYTFTRKVGDKLNSLIKKDRKKYEEKWNDIKIIIEYGMLSEDKFFEKSDSFSLYPDTNNNFFTYDELINDIKKMQTNKDGKTIILYASNAVQCKFKEV